MTFPRLAGPAARILALLLPAALVAAVDRPAYEAAVKLYTGHRPVEARAAFEALLATDPDNADIRFYLGRLALQRNDAAAAVAQLERAVALAPGDARMQQRLGDAYGLSAQKAGLFAKLGWAHKSQAAYERAVTLDPASVDARSALMNFYLEAPAIAGGDVAQALAQALEIKRLDPARGRIAVALVRGTERKYDLAFAEFEEALQAAPDDYVALFQLGRLAAVSGERLDRGLAALRRCLELSPPPGQPGPAAVQGRIGAILERQGDRAGARLAYEAALRADAGFRPAAEALDRLK